MIAPNMIVVPFVTNMELTVADIPLTQFGINAEHMAASTPQVVHGTSIPAAMMCLFWWIEAVIFMGTSQ
jgi:hypothetical protein